MMDSVCLANIPERESFINPKRERNCEIGADKHWEGGGEQAKIAHTTENKKNKSILKLYFNITFLGCLR
jgi:hypothetical protein